MIVGQHRLYIVLLNIGVMTERYKSNCIVQ